MAALDLAGSACIRADVLANKDLPLAVCGPQFNIRRKVMSCMEQSEVQVITICRKQAYKNTMLLFVTFPGGMLLCGGGESGRVFVIDTWLALSELKLYLLT